MKFNLLSWPCRQSRSGPCRLTVGTTKIEATYQFRNNQNRLSLSKARTNTRVWTNPKGNIRAVLYRTSALDEKAIGYEGVGVLPITLVPVNGPWRDHHQRPALQFPRANLTILKCNTGDKGYRRIEPEGLPEHGPNQRQLFHVIKMNGARPDHLFKLVTQSQDQGWLFSQQVKNPGQGAGGGLMSRQKKHAQLIDQLLSRERFPRIRIFGCNHITCNIIEGAGIFQMRIQQITQSALGYAGKRPIPPGAVASLPRLFGK